MLKRILFLFLLFCFTCSTVYADSEGANNPQTMADDDAVGTAIWSDYDYIAASDDDYANSTGSYDTYSHYLKATNFGFSIPTGATINGILVEIERKRSITYEDIKDSEVKIVKSNGSIGTTNKADTVNNWPVIDTYKSYGNSSDLWGESWTAEDINNSNFGIVLSVYFYDVTGDPTAYVDHIRITVYYTTGAVVGQVIIVK